MTINKDQMIGWFSNHKVYCFDHTPDGRKCYIFHVNIFPYKQTCFVCKKVLVQPQTESWPELFTGRS